ncbi:MAG: hypothetical protein Q7S21_07635 [archaeon]|nr:hypothetical protein [archaeon]
MAGVLFKILALANSYMKGLLLLSGGIDSPVAGMLAKNNGIDLSAVHFSIEPFTDDSPEKKSRNLAQKLGIQKFIKVSSGKYFKQIASNAEQKYYFILSKIFMQKVSEQIAQKLKADFLITGENLAQVSSQTLTNLSIISQAVSLPVLRPLLALDKLEIVRLSHNFGFYETSKGKESCDVLGPKHPSTKAKQEVIEEQEKLCNLDFLVQECVKEIQIE